MRRSIAHKHGKRGHGAKLSFLGNFWVRKIVIVNSAGIELVNKAHDAMNLTITSKSIISAGSVVETVLPSDSIASGNPCREIKQL